MMKALHILFFLFLCTPLVADDKAFAKYTEAEHTTSVEARKKEFNETLSLYLQMEPEHPSGPLCFDIANTYFQLGEYGFAILYYYKALDEMPRDSRVRANLQVALQKAGLPKEVPSFVDDYLLFFHTKLSHNEKGFLVLGLFLAVFALLSLHIWQPLAVLKKLSYFCLAIALLIFASLVWTDYFAYPEAVIVRATPLRRDAGEQYAALSGHPGVPGMKVKVLSVQQQGNWLKVRLSSGEEGYVAKEYVRLITTEN